MYKLGAVSPFFIMQLFLTFMDCQNQKHDASRCFCNYAN